MRIIFKCKPCFCQTRRLYRWSKTIVGQVDLTEKLCLSCCLELQSAKSTCQHVDFDKPRLNIRVMREAWCVKRDACSPNSLKIERATPHVRHSWCMMRIRFGLAYSPLWERSTRITRAYHDIILWILPGTSQDPCMRSRDNHIKHRPCSKTLPLHLSFLLHDWL